MSPITTPIRPDNKKAITNLQSALLFLLSKGSISLKADELNTLQKQCQKEQQEANYGEATTKLVAVFQKQNGINDHLGTVEMATASKLNEVLKSLGAFDKTDKSQLVAAKLIESLKKLGALDKPNNSTVVNGSIMFEYSIASKRISIKLFDIELPV